MGRKEDNIKRAETLLHKKEFIRNIGTAAHIDHRQCCHAQMQVWVHGRWIKAEEVWGTDADRPAIPNACGADVRDVRGDSLWTFSVDMASGIPQFSQITHAWRLRASEPLIEIEARDGRIARTTPEHRYLVASSHVLQFREAKSLRKGEMLVVPRHLPSRESEEDWPALEGAILKKLASNANFLFYLTRAGAQVLDLDGPVRGDALFDGARRKSLEPNQLYRFVAKLVHHPSQGGRASSPIR